MTEKEDWMNMKKHFNYFDFEKKDVELLRREMTRQAFIKTAASMTAGVVIIMIGLYHDINIMDSPVKISNPSYMIFLVSLAFVVFCFGLHFCMAIRSVRLTKKDILQVIAQIAPDGYHIIKTRSGGLLVQTLPVSDDDKRQSLHILKRMELNYPHLSSEFMESLKGMIKARDHELSVEGVLRTEIIYEQLMLGNEKIVDSIEQNYRNPK